MSHPFRLCYITDRHALEPQPVVARIGEAARAGVDLIQVREKDLGTRDLVELVRAALEAIRGTETRLVVNDRLDVALSLGAHGVHLSVQSLPAREVRRRVPEGFLVGVSCHSLEEAQDAESARADYIVLGPIFPTTSKIKYGPPLGLETLASVTKQVKVPVLALGGVTPERVSKCLRAGVAGIAGISIFQSCPSTPERVRELHRHFQHG